MKKDSKKAAKPKKPPARSLEEIEIERRDRRLEILKKKFEVTIKHMGQVEKVNEEYYKARKSLADAAKTKVAKRDPYGRDRL